MKLIQIFSIILCILFFVHANADYSMNPHEQLQKMTLRQKIAQLIIAAAVSNETYNRDFIASSVYRMDHTYVEDLISLYQIGGIIFMGTGLTQEQAELTKRFQALSPHIPLLIALDAEWGLAMRLQNGFRYPYNMTLGALTDNDLIYQMAYQIGLELAEIGVHLNLAPVVDVNNNPLNPVINVRSFGADPANVAAKGVAYIQGMQDAGILACAKHFPGHGDTSVDSHEKLPIIVHDKNHLNTVELLPFKKAIEHGVKAVMTAHLHVRAYEPNGSVPATLSKTITTDLLRSELGFQGLIITDGLGMKGVTDNQTPGYLEICALEAGADMLLCPIDPIKVMYAIEQAVQSGRISEQSINEKVLRVLQAKQWALSHALHKASDKRTAMRIKKEIYSKVITIAKDTLDPERDKAMDVIVPITGVHPYKSAQCGITSQKLAQIHQLKQEGKHVTVILYGCPYALDLVQEADRIIVAYEEDGAAYEAVQQILAGFAQPEGKLPI